MRPRVGIVVLNWNNEDDTLECLASVTASTYPTIAGVILVDNHSDQDPSNIVMARFPNVHVARQSANLGYAGGNNIGIVWALEAAADYVLILNNDAVIASDAIERLVDVAERNGDAAFVTPRILVYGKDEVYWDGGTVNWSTGDVTHDSSSLPLKHERVRESAWSNGCAPLVRVKAIRDIGLMDPDFFLYYEDVDWSARASKAGWKHLVALDAVCWHKVSRTSGGIATPLSRYYYARNRYRLLARHTPTYASFEGIVRYARRILRDYHWHRDNVEVRRAIVEGTLDLVQRRWGARPGRHPGLMALCDAVFYAISVAAVMPLAYRYLVRRLPLTRRQAR
jgi:GT2 family glycosyltransferase